VFFNQNFNRNQNQKFHYSFTKASAYGGDWKSSAHNKQIVNRIGGSRSTCAPKPFLGAEAFLRSRSLGVGSGEGSGEGVGAFDFD